MKTKDTDRKSEKEGKEGGRTVARWGERGENQQYRYRIPTVSTLY